MPQKTLQVDGRRLELNRTEMNEITNKMLKQHLIRLPITLLGLNCHNGPFCINFTRVVDEMRV